MSYSISFDVFRNNCKHFYQVSFINGTNMERCRILTKKEFNGLLNKLDNLEGWSKVNCVEDKCPILNSL